MSALRSIEPADGRVVFLDTETTGLDDERRMVWEVGAIVRDPGQPDREYEWQIRPHLRDAEPTGLRIGRYYRRCQLIDSSPGAARVIVHPDLDPDKDYKGLEVVETHAAAVAGQLARMLDDAHIVGAVPNFDEHSLIMFMRDNGQALTSHYHLMDVEGMSVGFAHGVLRGAAGTLDGLGLPVDELRQIPGMLPWDSETLSRAVGVTPPPKETRHRALVDARWARDTYDAITGYKPPAA